MKSAKKEGERAELAKQEGVRAELAKKEGVNVGIEQKQVDIAPGKNEESNLVQDFKKTLFPSEQKDKMEVKKDF